MSMLEGDEGENKYGEQSDKLVVKLCKDGLKPLIIKALRNVLISIFICFVFYYFN